MAREENGDLNRTFPIVNRSSTSISELSCVGPGVRLAGSFSFLFFLEGEYTSSCRSLVGKERKKKENIDSEVRMMDVRAI